MTNVLQVKIWLVLDLAFMNYNVISGYLEGGPEEDAS
jgi:hypothetical protein